MKEKLTQYVELLFAGAADCEDIKQEILQNTLDRYDDLIAEGKVPEAAYRLAITGIGDISEILGSEPQMPNAAAVSQSAEKGDTSEKKQKRALAIALYILCPVPVILFGSISDVMAITGICLMFSIVAYATYLMIVNSSSEKENEEPEETGLRKNIKNVVWAIALAVYFVLSFATGDWYITWVIFVIGAAVNNLISAILDLKEGKHNEI